MRIKAKDGYNVIINDLNMALQHGKGFYEVSEEAFNNSNDVKTLVDYIEIDNNINTSINKKTVVNTNIKKTKEAYVVDNNNTKQSNAIVIDPNNEADIKQVKSLQNENIKKEKNKKDDELIQVEQVKIDTDTNIEESVKDENISENTSEDTSENDEENKSKRKTKKK